MYLWKWVFIALRILHSCKTGRPRRTRLSLEETKPNLGFKKNQMYNRKNKKTREISARYFEKISQPNFETLVISVHSVSSFLKLPLWRLLKHSFYALSYVHDLTYLFFFGGGDRRCFKDHSSIVLVKLFLVNSPSLPSNQRVPLFSYIPWIVNIRKWHCQPKKYSSFKTKTKTKT